MKRIVLWCGALLGVCLTAVATPSREATFGLTAPVVPSAGETLVLPSFDGRTVSCVLGTRQVSTTGVVTYTGRTDDAVGHNVTVTVLGDGCLVRIDDARHGVVRSYRVKGDSVVVRERARSKGGRCGAEAVGEARGLSVPPPRLATARQAEPDPLVDGAAFLRRGETVTNVIDVLIAVDRSAATWIRERSDFTEAPDPVLYFAADSIARCNAIYANTDLDKFFTFNLAGVIELAADFSTARTPDGYVDSYTILTGYTENRGAFKGEWARVREKRETVCADLVSIFVSCGSDDPEGVVGLGTSLTLPWLRDASFSDTVSNVCLVEAVACDNTLAHEIGHNMGAGHAEMVDRDQSGPQLYDYTTGWKFAVTNAEGAVIRHATTVMGYSDDGHSEENQAEWGEPPECLDWRESWYWENGYYLETDFFSSSVHTYAYIDESGERVDSGVPLGDARHDNTRLLSKIYPVVANFRVRKSTLTLVDPRGGAKTLTGSGAYANGKAVTMKATPQTGYVFAGWYLSYDEKTGEFADPVVSPDGADYRNPTLTYAIPAEGTTASFVYARLLTKEEAAGLMAFDQEDREFVVDGGLPIAPIALSVTSDILPKVAVSGLPSGLKYDAKTGAVAGTPTKAGRFAVKVSLTSAAVTKAVERYFTIVVRDFELSVVAGKGGTVKGAGRALAGKKLTLSAKADRDFVFAGWYDAAGEPLVGTADYRTPSWTVTMTNADLRIEARFAGVGADELEIRTADGYATAVDGSFDLIVPVDSLSLPKLTVKGLPAGLKFDAKLNRISGRATKPGVYVVEVSATNVSKRLEKKTLTLVVPNIESPAFLGLEYGSEDYPLFAGTAFDPAMIDLSTEEGWTLSAMAGLPAGLKFNAKTGEITGVPTKAGAYTVTLTAKNGRATSQATVTFAVAALPSWAYGTFDGGALKEGAANGLATLTVTAAGKLSGKVQKDGLSWTVSAPSFADVEVADETDELVFLTEAVFKSGKLAETNLLGVVRQVLPDGCVLGCFAYAELEESAGLAEDLDVRRNLWKTGPLPEGYAEIDRKVCEIPELGLSLKTAKSGAVTATGKFVTGRDAAGRETVYSATCSSVLLPCDEFVYDVYLYFPPKAGKFEGYATCVRLGWDAKEKKWQVL